MSEDDVGTIFAKLLVLQADMRNVTKSLDEHNDFAVKRQDELLKTIDLIFKKIDCQNKRCFDHAPIIDGFEKHLESHEEIKKLSGARNFAIFIAMGGWALGLTSIVVNFLRQ